MKPWWLALSVLAACGAPVVTDVDTDTDIVETDTDTDVVDTDTDGGDTWVVDTAVGRDTVDDSGLDTDDTDAGNDTAICKFGESPDCNGRCFPDYFRGDGYCDDGDPLPADFNCASWAFDEGDCNGIDDTGPIGTACEYRLEFNAREWANEIFWRVDTLDGRTVAQIQPGSYGSNNRLYTHVLRLESGSYRFVGLDDFGDGWHGATWQIIDPVTGHLIRTAGADFTNGSSRSWTFEVDCDRQSCNFDVVTIGGPTGDEIGWELFTSGGRPAGSRLPGTAQANGTVTDRLQLYTGEYTLRTRDAGGDGFNGGWVEMRYGGGLLQNATAIERPVGFGNGGSGVEIFNVDCDLGGQQGFDQPGQTIRPTSCDNVVFELSTEQKGNEVGFQLIETATWRTVRTVARGTMGNNQTRNFQISLNSGLYFIRHTDSGNDGWQDGRLKIRDPNTNENYRTFIMPGNSTLGRYVQIECPVIVDTDTDTDTPIETDTDTSVPPQNCLPGSVPDCDGVCFPQSLVGDNFCDDGSGFAPNFNCTAFSFDGGDCTP